MSKEVGILQKKKPKRSVSIVSLKKLTKTKKKRKITYEMAFRKPPKPTKEIRRTIV